MRPLVLHAADLHLDAPFEGIGRTPAHIAAALRDASLAAWEALIELALARQVAAVLLAGGVCDGLERGARAQARLRDGIGRLAAAGVRVFIALGDRDPLEGFAAVSQWPPNVTVFAPGEQTSYWLECDGARIGSVHGISAVPGRPAAPAPRLQRTDAQGPHFAVLHADLDREVSAVPAAGACAPARLTDLHAAGMDYWALGHRHALDYRSTGAPWIVYPGTLQGRGLTAAECGPKGAVLIEIAGGAIARVDFEPLDQVRCVRVELADAADVAAAVRALTQRAAELHERHPGRGLLLDAHVYRSAPVAGALRRASARAEVLRGVRRAAQAWEPFVWWAGMHVEPAVGDASGAGLPAADDLASEVRRRQAELMADSEQAARFLARRCEPLRSAWTADLDPRETERLLEEAAARAVDALREDNA